MEEVKKKKSPKGWGSDFMLRILAVIIAVIIWLVLSITQYPTKNKTITNVPVDFSTDGTAIAEKGLSVLNYKDITVDVEIKGMNYEIGSYTANDLSATVNLDSVTKEGTYNLDIEVKSTHSSDSITVVSVNPETVEVTFDRISTATFNVSAEAPLVKADDGLTLKEITAVPYEVEVEGPDNEISKIDRIVARVNDSAVLSEDTTLKADEVVFYDSDDNELDSSVFTIKDVTDFDVSFVVYRKKTANLTVDFSECPAGFDTTSIPYELSDSSIQVISPKLDDSDTENLKLGTIALNTIDLDSTFTFSIDSALPSGEINQTGISTVTVSFDSSEYSENILTVPSGRISTRNAPEGKTVTIDTKQIPDVIVIGPSNVISTLEADDLIVVLDLSDVLDTGSVTHSVQIYAPEHDDVWCSGTYEVQVEIADKVDSASETSSSSSE